MLVKVDAETLVVLLKGFRRDIEVVSEGQIEVPDYLTLTALNNRLHRMGYEAWSRFPGMSLRVRKYPVRVRGGREALRWQEDPERMAKKRNNYPAWDELFSQPLMDKRAEILARLPSATREEVHGDYVPEEAPRRRVNNPRRGELFPSIFAFDSTMEARRDRHLGMGTLAEYVLAKYYAARMVWGVRKARCMPGKLRRFSQDDVTPFNERLAAAGASYISERLRETSFMRKILPPTQVVGP